MSEKDWGYWLKHPEEMTPYNEEFVDYVVQRIYTNTHIKTYRDGTTKIKTYVPNYVKAPWLSCMGSLITHDYELLKLILEAKKKRTKTIRYLAYDMLRKKVKQYLEYCYHHWRERYNK